MGNDASIITYGSADEYGDHLEKSTRYPMYNRSGMYEKMVRAIEDMNAGTEIKCDTLIDLANYALMELSTKLNL